VRSTERTLVVTADIAAEAQSATPAADQKRAPSGGPAPRPTPPSVPCIRVTAGADIGRSCEVGTGKVTIGAAPSNTLCLTDRHISRRHCEIFARDGEYVIRDLGSTNGTFVDSHQITEVVVTPESRIHIGRTELALQRHAQGTAASSPAPDAFGELLGRSKPMLQAFGALHTVARSSLTCLLLGETGTGKELAARALHAHSDRAGKPFLVVDCAGVGPQFIEDKLFGHQRGAFTGASQTVAGVFEEAHGGTVFLDEIGELPLELQPKLLGVLERREATRIGSHAPVKLDFRLVAATHRNLADMARRGRFRQDLLYRLSEFTVRIPSLRERKDDIGLLAHAVLEREGYPRTLTPEAVEYLKTLGWPGNVRELRNLMRRAAVLAANSVIDRALLEDLDAAVTSEIHLPEELLESLDREPEVAPAGRSVKPAAPSSSAAPQAGCELPLAEATEAFRRAYLQQLRERFGSDFAGAARHAGVHPKSVQRLFRLYGIS
jgi:transcriptional regulator with GAF, ATPase, and Fis domain